MNMSLHEQLLHPSEMQQGLLNRLIKTPSLSGGHVEASISFSLYFSVHLNAFYLKMNMKRPHPI